jgi:hypothetical protein
MPSTSSTPDARRIFVELRMGDVLEVGGARIQLEFKKGQAARMVVRYGWHEETADRGNQVIITRSSIFGVKKTVFEVEGEKQDHGVYGVDTAAASR